MFAVDYPGILSLTNLPVCYINLTIGYLLIVYNNFAEKLFTERRKNKKPNPLPMKHRLLLLLLIVSFYPLKAQINAYLIPNYDKIKTEIADSASSFYYPALIERLVEQDTTITLEEFRHLYFGYVFQPKYNPYWTSPDEKELIKYYRSEKIDPKDYDKIIKLATHAISEFPFDLRQLNYLSYIYHLKGEEENARKVSYQFRGILDSILSSGDGKTEETAYHVISVSHEYVFMNIFGFELTRQSLIDGKSGACDLLDLAKNENNIEHLYFNVDQLLKKNRELMKLGK